MFRHPPPFLHTQSIYSYENKTDTDSLFVISSFHWYQIYLYSVKREDRLWTFCNLQEILIFFQYPCYAHIRQPWLQNVHENYYGFNTLNIEEKTLLPFWDVSLLYCQVYPDLF